MTPITKNSIHASVEDRGVMALPKTIAVVDENGNHYEATYPKRARGLVKNGRARFVNEDTICLVRPPDIRNESEESHMSQNMVSMDKILEQLNEIVRNSEHVTRALDLLAEMNTGVSAEVCVPDLAGQARAQAIQAIVSKREETNRQLITLYSGMLAKLGCLQDDVDNR